MIGYGGVDPTDLVFAQTTSVVAPNLPNMGGEKIVHVVCDKMAHGNFVHG